MRTPFGDEAFPPARLPLAAHAQIPARRRDFFQAMLHLNCAQLGK